MTFGKKIFGQGRFSSSCYCRLTYLVFFIQYSVHQSLYAATLLTNETDQQALFKISQLINGGLPSWNNKSLHFCSWYGVTCGIRHQRVLVLDISSLKLTGSLCPFVGNLTFLRGLNIQNNQLRGTIPPSIAKLTRLRYLRLANNSFQGEVPSGLSHCSQLKALDFMGNDLVGNIPTEFGSLSGLNELSLDRNNFTGRIPSSFGNLTSLRILGLSRNHLQGSIPSELGRLPNLYSLRLSSNRLSGIVPSQLYNISSIQTFSITNNKLRGQFPSDLGITLPNLNQFLADLNHFTGSIPSSLANASRLLKISIGDNNLTGHIPLNFGRLQDLQVLHLGHNPLGTHEVSGANFLPSLINCSNLKTLSLSITELGGLLPKSIGNLSSKLSSLYLNENSMYGTIPTEISNLASLTYLTLDTNMFTGNIPDSIGKLTKMQELYFYENRITGKIPSSIGNITGLNILILEGNMIDGGIPISLGNCTELQGLHLASNRLTGPIPQQVFSLSSLSIGLNLFRNRLTGSLPAQIGNLKNLALLDLSGNKLSGEIPSNIGDCVMLESLNLKENLFEGTIPSTLENLRSIEVIDLSQNNLSGQIPETLENLRLISTLNLSFNKLEGEVPKQGPFSNITKFLITGNKNLCGGIKQLNLSPCSTETTKEKRTLSCHTIVILATIIPSFILLLLASLFAVYRLKNKHKNPISSTLAEDDNRYPKISYAELLESTDQFSFENLVGEGRYGYVYKGILKSSDQIVAVKVLKLHEYGANKSFFAECEVLRNARHRNLVKIITSCSTIDFQGNDFKALVYEYVPNGSLYSWLYPNCSDRILLSLAQRLSVAMDVASALDYLHDHCTEPIVHCDLKPSNILLDDDFCAHVSDFGLARFLSAKKEALSHAAESSTIGIKGTIGYVAPEYGMGGEISKQGDVYSYGVLLLEMFTGKTPTDALFSESYSLHNYVKTALPDQVMAIGDPQVFLEVENDSGKKNRSSTNKMVEIEECLVSILQIGLSCSAEVPGQRMHIRDVVVRLHKIRNTFF